MKSLLLLGSVLCITACGSNSGNGTSELQGGALPANAAQAPQLPAYTLPPANTQQPPLDPQTPPNNTQHPAAGNTGGPCAQAITAAQAAGCDFAPADIAACESSVAAGAPCSAQWQAELRCLVSHPIVCNDNGELNIDASCRAEALALGECVDATTPACTSPSCNGCTDACTTCLCHQITDTGRSCTNECAATN